MKEKLNKLLRNRYLDYAIIIIIAIFLSIKMFSIQITYADDGAFHILRMIGTGYSLENNIIPPLITPFFCNDFGYALNIFYQPIVTYLPILFTKFCRFNRYRTKILCCFYDYIIWNIYV